MLQLILGISLGLLLLFVVVVLVMEITATYSVWKHFHWAELSSPSKPVAVEKKRRFSKYAVTLLFIVVGLVTALLLFGNTNLQKKKSAAAMPDEPAVTVSGKKYLTDNLAGEGLQCTVLMKWEDGKIYCNNRVLFQGPVPPAFTDWHYSLLDKDGFLIKDFHLLQTDFSAELKNGQITALLNRCNASLGLSEYQRIAQLQVALDKKLSSR